MMHEDKYARTRAANTMTVGLLGVAFITLKLCDVIDWSWWWVLAPFWTPFALAALAFAFVGFMDLRKWTKEKRKQ
jgi:phosphate/sulfate permease